MISFLWIYFPKLTKLRHLFLLLYNLNGIHGDFCVFLLYSSISYILLFFFCPMLLLEETFYVVSDLLHIYVLQPLSTHTFSMKAMKGRGKKGRMEKRKKEKNKAMSHFFFKCFFLHFKNYRVKHNCYLYIHIYWSNYLFEAFFLSFKL